MWKGKKFADNIGGKLAMFRRAGIRKQGIRWGLQDLLHCRSVIKECFGGIIILWMIKWDDKMASDLKIDLIIFNCKNSLECRAVLRYSMSVLQLVAESFVQY